MGGEMTDASEYEAARQRYRDAKARRDTRRQHEAEAETRRALHALMRRSQERPRWRRLLDAWRGR